MKMVLVNTKKTLEETVLPFIHREMLNSSAREHLGLFFLVFHTFLGNEC